MVELYTEEMARDEIAKGFAGETKAALKKYIQVDRPDYDGFMKASSEISAKINMIAREAVAKRLEETQAALKGALEVREVFRKAYETSMTDAYRSAELLESLLSVAQAPGQGDIQGVNFHVPVVRVEAVDAKPATIDALGQKVEATPEVKASITIGDPVVSIVTKRVITKLGNGSGRSTAVTVTRDGKVTSYPSWAAAIKAELDITASTSGDNARKALEKAGYVVVTN